MDFSSPHSFDNTQRPISPGFLQEVKEIKDDTPNDVYDVIPVDTKKSHRKKCALVILCFVLILAVILAVAIAIPVALKQSKYA